MAIFRSKHKKLKSRAERMPYDLNRGTHRLFVSNSPDEGWVLVWDKTFGDFQLIDDEGWKAINWDFRQELQDEHEWYYAAGLEGGIPRPPWAPRVLDLFSGAGGFSLGFCYAYMEANRGVRVNREEISGATHDYNPASAWKNLRPQERPWDMQDDPDMPEIIGVELAKDACRTYQFNRCGQAIRADVRHLPFRPMRGLFDIIIGGPPCQPFSSINTSKTRGEKHSLHDMVGWFLYWCAYFAPDAFVMENVPRIVNDPFYGPLFKQLARLQELGWEELNSVHIDDFLPPGVEPAPLIVQAPKKRPAKRPSIMRGQRLLTGKSR